jgi:hypothetical protein
MRTRYIPLGATKVTDKNSDAVAYLYTCKRGRPCAIVYYGKQSKAVGHHGYRHDAEREKSVVCYFERRQSSEKAQADYKTSRQTKAAEFANQVEVGDIFHYQFGYDETHHVFFEVVEVKGRYATVRKIEQAQLDLGYDWRHRCMPQSGAFRGEPQRVLIQDGRIKVDRHYHATKWNTERVAGVPVGPSYVGGGAH